MGQGPGWAGVHHACISPRKSQAWRWEAWEKEGPTRGAKRVGISQKPRGQVSWGLLFLRGGRWLQ